MTISNLTEYIILLTNSPIDLTKNRYEKFQKSLSVRAKVVPLTKDKIEIIITPPPAKFSNQAFVGVIWNDQVYLCLNPFLEYKDKFLKGRFSLN